MRIKTTTKNSLYGVRKQNNKSKHIATGQHNQTLKLKPFFGKLHQLQTFLKLLVEFYSNYITFKNSTCNLSENIQINKKLKIFLQTFIKYKIPQTFSQFYFHLLPLTVTKNDCHFINKIYKLEKVSLGICTNTIFSFE